jgi:hypothetical protein
MNDDIKQIQGIKRPYDSNPTTTNAGYQPVAKKKKGQNCLNYTILIRCFSFLQVYRLLVQLFEN